MKIHYATGGLIVPGQKAEFSTLCGRTFEQGHSEIMQSGYAGAKNVTCAKCREKLDIQKRSQNHRDAIMSLVNLGRFEKLAIIK